MKQLLVICHDKTFKIAVPDDAKLTFGPWAPPQKKSGGWNGGSEYKPNGTLRVYQGSKENILACFSDVVSFRDLSMEYAEQVAKEEGATIWKSDHEGYVREDKISRKKEWVNPQLPAAKVKKGKSNA